MSGPPMTQRPSRWVAATCGSARRGPLDKPITAALRGNRSPLLGDQALARYEGDQERNRCSADHGSRDLRQRLAEGPAHPLGHDLPV